ncbi:hypothetical protein [Arthrobacter sp. zg-Y877]|uniref:hypothetical protein n=1 Tax=Arthrobacter sp. zg-Y877 TaxID=3049074 RepID=UPI0025A3AD57|nr:hypothetical protein [Arthrobacter sp. zg-Y877]MDM7990702.1 hypothetical protein [Arthrobacter sp. zg-Y877]
MDKRGGLLRAVKAFHTFAWVTIEGCMLYVLVSGVRKRSDQTVGIAATVVAAETLVFTSNGFHCPLTAVARDLGDSTGSVTDIYLPQWLARNLPAIHVPLIIAAVVLHWRNISASKAADGNAAAASEFGPNIRDDLDAGMTACRILIIKVVNGAGRQGRLISESNLWGKVE